MVITLKKPFGLLVSFFGLDLLYVLYVNARCSQRSEEGVRSPGCGYWELTLAPLYSEPSLQPGSSNLLTEYIKVAILFSTNPFYFAGGFDLRFLHNSVHLFFYSVSDNAM